MGKETLCINHLFRPEYAFEQEGWGDCQKCVSNKDNKNCAGYTPVVVTTYEVKE